MADPADVAHLLRRTEFVARPARVAALSNVSIEAAVDDVMNVALNGNPGLPGYLTTPDSAHGWEQYVFATNWWLDMMRDRPRPLQEKLTLFWHGHFTSAFDDVGRADYMMRQNQLYRSLGLGDFRTLTQAAAIEPAMLVYLNNADNRKESPNQNFARELMELFTLGVGNYSEDDVEAAARAWTGHNADWPDRAYTFFPDRHDFGPKTFFGTTKDWNGPDIIDEILRDNVTKRQIAGRFIARKLWDFFAYPGGPAGVIDSLATVFVNSGLQIRSLLRAMFTHPEFYSHTAKTGLVRTPVEYMVALSYHTGVGFNDLGAPWMAERMGQELLNPPNVAGWKANGAWLNTGALSARAQMARTATWKLRENDGFAHLNSLSAPAAVDSVAAQFGITLSSTTRNALIAANTAERTAQPWPSWWAPTNLLTMTMLAPEFHMA